MVTKKDLDKIIKQERKQDVKVEIDVGLKKPVVVTVHPVIAFTDYCAAVKEMANMQFIVDEDTGALRYAPYLREFAERYITLAYYTDIDVSAGDANVEASDDDVNRLWGLMWSSDAFTKICEVIDHQQMTSLYDAAAEQLNETRKVVEPGAAKLWADLDALVEDTKRRLGEMTPEDGEAIRMLASKLGNLDEGKIVELMR